jgi:predicted GIY-YIG superfamily endonuclease
VWFYVYVLMNEKQELYIGRTNDLRRRVKAHNQGKSQYTKQHQDWFTLKRSGRPKMLTEESKS